MYPDRELSALAARKTALRAEIGRRRTRTVATAARLARPWRWLDRLTAFSRRLAVFAPLASGALGALLPWGSLLGGVTRIAGLAINFNLWSRPTATAPQ